MHYLPATSAKLGRMTDKSWLFYAIFAAVSAAFVGIFAKVGMEGIDPTLATTVRSFIMLLFLMAICTAQGVWNHLEKIRGWAVIMIALSGIAGATSWLFGFKALASGGQFRRFARIDKLSVPLAAVSRFSCCVIGRQPSTGRESF